MTETDVQYCLRNTETGMRITLSETAASRPITAAEYRDGWRVIERREITYGDWETVQETTEPPAGPVREKPLVTPRDIGRMVSVPAPGGGRVTGRIRGVGGNKGGEQPLVTVAVPQGTHRWSAYDIRFLDSENEGDQP